MIYDYLEYGANIPNYFKGSNTISNNNLSGSKKSYELVELL